MKKLFFASFLPIFTSITSLASSSSEYHQPIAVRESSLLISTLDGTLHAVGQKSGLLKWSIHETPILKLPSMANITQRLTRTLFLPDPKDGSLYLYNGIGNVHASRETLEKLPFTISELVSASPCRSSDGHLYTGKKNDEWITINAQTGDKVNVLNSDTPMCPSPSPSIDGQLNNNLLYLGKSEYHISVFDLKTKEKTWNISLVDYSSSASISVPQSAYELLHLTSSTTGRIATIDLSGDSNHLLWTHQFASPIVAIFQFNDGISPALRRVPFSTIGGSVSPRNIQQHNPLYPSLYIGEMDGDGDDGNKSIYALSTLVDISQTSLISLKNKRKLLIEGPRDDSFDTVVNEYTNVLMYGYYEYPQISQNELIPQLQITQTPKDNLLTSVEKPLMDRIILKLPQNLTVPDEIVNYHQIILSILAMASFGGSIFVAVVFHFFFRRKTSSVKTQNDKNANFISVGKIDFDPKSIIGRGCSGTCVYKGLFEGKQNVAVKRVIADYFVLADREIELLRSLQHPHLIRYFATESDEMFRYIAIELAEVTLSDYIERKNEFINDLNDYELLEQSCHGLVHLHSLNVIHRDIKPQNILISLPLPPNGRRKAMISDFGVSKVLTAEHSLSEVSATLKGTEGWIPPEVLKAKAERIRDFKPSKPIDIFSLGCLFYYVFTNGQHPFGDLLHRQSNILRGDCKLDAVTDEESLCKYNIIEAMINYDPLKRPAIESVIKHPIFWDSCKSLQFLQDVSDRIEKEPIDSSVVINLENGNYDVTKGDWRRHLSIELQSDLRKFRSYKGSSVRDLLRAIRNKRHHYRELPEDVQQSLGPIPNDFVTYFTSRFPRLLVHSYIAIQCCKSEHVFQPYYNNDSFHFESLPRSGIRWFLKNTDSFMPNGMGTDDSLSAINWKSCKRKGSPIKRLEETAPDMSPKFGNKVINDNLMDNEDWIMMDNDG